MIRPGQSGTVRASRDARPARHRGVRPAGCGAVGIAHKGCGAHLPKRDVLGSLRPAGQDRPGAEQAGPGGFLALAGRPMHAVIDERAYNAETGTFVSSFGGKRSRRHTPAAGRNRFRHRPTTRASLRPSRRSGQKLRRGDLLHALRRGGRFRVDAHGLHDLRLLVCGRAECHRPQGGGAGTVRADPQVPKFLRVCFPRMQTSRPASCGAISLRLIRWSALSIPPCG